MKREAASWGDLKIDFYGLNDLTVQVPKRSWNRLLEDIQVFLLEEIIFELKIFQYLKSRHPADPPIHVQISNIHVID